MTCHAPLCALGAALLLLAACSPAHDWRDTRSADGAVGALFPCKAQLHERRIELAGHPVKLALLACDAGGQTWGLASADLTDPARQAVALDALAQAAGANVAAAASSAGARAAGASAAGASAAGASAAGAASVARLQVPGATPHAGSRRLRLQGRRPDGQPVQVHVALFTHGTHVYQATVIGDRVPDELADTYFGSLRVSP